MCENIRFDRDSAFDEVEGGIMVDSSILNTNAYKIIEKDFLSKIDEGSEYLYEMYLLELQKIGIKFENW